MDLKLKNYEKYFIILSLVLGVLLLFMNLGDRFFGPTDETYVALRVAEVLQNGYPNDLEVSLITLPHIYLASLSSLLFGLNEVSIRLISAIFGVAFLVLFVIFLKENVRDVKTRIVSLLLVVFSTLFYLHARHGRYYSMVMFSTLLTYYFFIKFMKGQKNSKKYFVVSSIFMFYSHMEIGFYVLLSIFIFSLVERRSKIRDTILLFLPIAIFSSPLILVWMYFRQNLTPFSAVFNPIFVLFNALSGLFYLIVFLLPTPIIVLGLYILSRYKFNLRKLRSEYKLFIFTILVAIIVSSFIGAFGPIHIRKLIVFIPLTSILTASIISQVFLKKNNMLKIVGLFILFLLIFTNFVHIFPLNVVKEVDLGLYAPKDVTERFLSRSLEPRYYFFDFLNEIGNHYETTTASVFKILSYNYTEGDRVFLVSKYVSSQPLSLKLNMSIEHINTYNNISRLNTTYDWIIIDNFTNTSDFHPENYVDITKYDLFLLNNTGDYYSETPDLVHHIFIMRKNGYIYVYKKIVS